MKNQYIFFLAIFAYCYNDGTVMINFTFEPNTFHNQINFQYKILHYELQYILDYPHIKYILYIFLIKLNYCIF